MKQNTSKIPFNSADLSAGASVFLVTLPLCLGIAHASGAPLFSGLLSGIVAGLIVAWISGSQTSVSGAAIGLVTLVFMSIQQMGSYSAFLTAVILAGFLQLLMGFARAGIISNYFPSNVIKGLLSGIGIILILKQIPHAVGYDLDAEGEFAFLQGDHQNTFSELWNILDKVHWGAVVISIIAIITMIYWEKIKIDKLNKIPAPLIVVILGVLINEIFIRFLPDWLLKPAHLVTVPVSNDLQHFIGLLHFPDFSVLLHSQVYFVALSLAIVASLETLLNIEAVDKLDPQKRYTPPNRELLAQGVGNIFSGFIGGLPITSVILRGTVNINAGAKSKVSAFVHGCLLLITTLAFPIWLNKIPLAALAGILIVTGYKLAKISLFKEMHQRGLSQFVPFMTTVVAIVFTDLIIGILMGMAVAVFFILKSNFQNPFQHIRQNHHIGEIIRIELSPQVTFLNKASLFITLDGLPESSQVVIDANDTEFIDYDVLEVISEFKTVKAPAKNIQVSLEGFKDHYQYDLKDHIHFYSAPTQEVQALLTPLQILDVFKAGNKRFIKNERINRNLMLQVKEIAKNQHPLAAILSCIDSRTTSELIFDLGLGDVFSVRMAGNVANEDVIGSLEYSCKVAGAKLLLVLGHTSCGAIKAACDGVRLGHITELVKKIEPAIEAEKSTQTERSSKNKEFVNNVTHNHVELTKAYLLENSEILREMVLNQEIMLVGGVYDLETGEVHFGEIFDKELISI
jgi:carbonic anhydrase